MKVIMNKADVIAQIAEYASQNLNMELNARDVMFYDREGKEINQFRVEFEIDNSLMRDKEEEDAD